MPLEAEAAVEASFSSRSNFERLERNKEYDFRYFDFVVAVVVLNLILDEQQDIFGSEINVQMFLTLDRALLC